MRGLDHDKSMTLDMHKLTRLTYPDPEAFVALLIGLPGSLCRPQHNTEQGPYHNDGNEHFDARPFRLTHLPPTTSLLFPQIRRMRSRTRPSPIRVVADTAFEIVQALDVARGRYQLGRVRRRMAVERRVWRCVYRWIIVLRVRR